MAELENTIKIKCQHIARRRNALPDIEFFLILF